MTKYVNEDLFDEKSKKMYYTLGVAYASYIPSKYHKDQVIFRSSSKELIDIVRDNLESDHNIILDNRGKSSYFFSFKNEYITFRLEGLGLVSDKLKRLFPNYINKEFLNHFIRGFFDAQGYILNLRGYQNRVSFAFNQGFLEELNKSLIKHADIKSNTKPRECTSRQYQISYGSQDSLRIHDFMYQDFDYIKDNNLYLFKKENLFNLNYKKLPTGPKKGTHHKKCLEKIDEAKKLILKGDKIKDISIKLGYTSYIYFYRTFSNVVGMSPTDFLSLNRDKNN